MSYQSALRKRKAARRLAVANMIKAIFAPFWALLSLAEPKPTDRQDGVDLTGQGR